MHAKPSMPKPIGQRDPTLRDASYRRKMLICCSISAVVGYLGGLLLMLL